MLKIHNSEKIGRRDFCHGGKGRSFSNLYRNENLKEGLKFLSYRDFFHLVKSLHFSKKKKLRLYVNFEGESRMGKGV